MKRRTVRLLILLFQVLLPQSAGAQAESVDHPLFIHSRDLPLSLNQHTWRYHAGDNPAWADRDLNDSGWTISQSLFYTGTLVKHPLDFPGVGWFRMQIFVDSTLLKPLAVTLIHSARANVFIDGRKIYATTALPSTPGQTDEFFKPPLIFTLTEPGLHLIAVRFADSARAAAAKKQDRGGFSATINTAPAALKAFHTQVTMVISAVVLFFTFFFSFCILHLLLFLYYRAERSNAYFSLFCLAIGSFFLGLYLPVALGNKVLQAFLEKHSLFVLAVIFATLSAFINELFARSRLRFRLAQVILLALVPAIFIQPAENYGLPLLMAAVCIEVVVLILRAIHRRVPGARIIGAGVLFFAVIAIGLAILAWVGPMFGFTLNDDAASMVVCTLFVLAILSVPLSMSAYLAWHYASVNHGLQRQLVEVERLSAVALELEGEKQRVLEHRADDLEHEVGIRTEELRRQRDKSDELLENILPAEVAEELKEKGSAAARLYDNVTVLFTDFADFTQRSEKLSPDELVGELNECFSAFDHIITRHGLEKIKTVGDAYIAVSGLPAANTLHARTVVAAALEVRAYMAARKVAHPGTFGIRLGVHSGPVVAGIVGIKKFAYDIWGDTVNTAARMEQHSEHGRLNISAATYELVKNDFTCTFRGELEVKHKGKMGMYFVEG